MALGACDGCRHTYVVDDEALPCRCCPQCHQPLRMASTKEVVARLRQANLTARQPKVQAVNGWVTGEPGSGHECVVDLGWQQTDDGRWKAVLVNRATGERHEVSSAPALRRVLERFLAASGHC